jgi:hypothetical protein
VVAAAQAERQPEERQEVMATIHRLLCDVCGAIATLSRVLGGEAAPLAYVDVCSEHEHLPETTLIVHATTDVLASGLGGFLAREMPVEILYQSLSGAALWRDRTATDFETLVAFFPEGATDDDTWCEIIDALQDAVGDGDADEVDTDWCHGAEVHTFRCVAA